MLYGKSQYSKCSSVNDRLKPGSIIFIDEARKLFQKPNGDVDWDKVEERWAYLKTKKESLGCKYFTAEVSKKARTL